MAGIERERAHNEERLNRHLTFFQSSVAQWNLFFARWINVRGHSALDPDTVHRANQEYSRRFSSGLAEKVEEALFRPEEFGRTISDYEQCIGYRPSVPFPTDTGWYRLIVTDPLRIEEELLLRETVLDVSPTDHSPLGIVDLGTGNGRMALSVSRMLSGHGFDEAYQIVGVDRERDNLRDGLRIAGESQVSVPVNFLLGDMTCLPLQSDSCSVMNAASCLHLVPEYEQPLVILEMLRCLHQGGEALITGPNERFSAESYIKCAIASNLEGYMLPWNLGLVQSLGRVGMIMDRMVKERLDYSYLKTHQICETLTRLECQPVSRNQWPREGSVPGIFSGIRFKVTAETKKLLRYWDRRGERKARYWSGKPNHPSVQTVA